MVQATGCTIILITLLIELLTPLTYAGEIASPKQKRWKVSMVGRIIPFAMPLEDPWIGGNYYQFDEMLRAGELDKVGLDVAFKDLREAARDNDAVAVHLLDLIDYAEKYVGKRNEPSRYTTLLVVQFDKDFGPRFLEDATRAWTAVAKNFVEPEAALPAKVFWVEPSQSTRWDGLRSYTTVFLIKGAPEGDWCRAMTIIPLGKYGTHMFVMNAAQSRCEQRYSEFQEMLTRLSYDPRLIQEVTGVLK